MPLVDVGITLAIAQARLQIYLDAEQRVLDGQAFRFADGREVTLADLKEIRTGLDYWSAFVIRLNPQPPKPVGRMRRGSYRSR